MTHDSTSPAKGRNDTQTASISKHGSTIETAAGTLHVKPYKSRGSAQLRAMITFAPRVSHFDTWENVASASDTFRGFFTLFWIAMFILAIRTYVVSFDQIGSPLNFNFAQQSLRHSFSLALSDGILVGSTVLCVPFAKALERGWIKYYWTGVIIQHIYQAVILFAAITWTFNRQWPWVQSGFFTLHALVMLMKSHSYMAVNGYLSRVNQLHAKTTKELHQACSAIGGYDAAVAEVRSRKREQMEKEDVFSTSTIETPPVSRSLLNPNDVSSIAIHNAATEAQLRNRLKSIPSSISIGTATPSPPISRSDSSYFPPGSPISEATHPLVDHPDEKISSLAQMLTDMESELTSVGKKEIRYPANLTYMNFADYQFIPTLVYELEYPRTDRVRPLYVVEKTVATFGTLTLLYSVVEQYVLPLTPQPNQSFFRSLLDLALPFMLCYLLVFYIIFECVCNGFAELSRFADRQFYEDWWNATTWDEFARKWNKPVHTFLLRHVYASTMSSYKLSKASASFLTFLLSSLVHELVMAIVTKKIRMYLFALQMAQVPLIAIGRIPTVRRNKTLGNIVFWTGLMAGFPVLCVAYCVY